MNKYFLSIMSILILFQSFRVLDEILYHHDDVEVRGYKIIDKENTRNNETKEEVKIELDIENLFTNADLKKGRKLSKQCASCHDFSKNLSIKIGPPLWGIVDRKTAIIADYKYSKSLSKVKRNWTKLELFNFLEEPKEYLKGTSMMYKGLKKIDDRIDLISYLESLR